MFAQSFYQYLRRSAPAPHMTEAWCENWIWINGYTAEFQMYAKAQGKRMKKLAKKGVAA
jgi:hypothetical protein